MFNRQFTQHTLESINLGSALWKVIHAVLNASVNGCLTTREVENAIRWHFPKQHFTQSNVGYSLSHSRDFKQVGFGGKGRRRWILTGTSDGIKRRGVATAHHSPTRFVRRYTHFTLGYVASEPGKIAMWKACHAVLNASTEGCLTTGEVEEALRLHYPDRTIKRSTVCYNLTESRDFKQVYLGGKTPGRWFLTGEVRGINRTNPDRAMELQVPIDVFSAGNEDDSDDDSDDDNDDLATPPDTPPAAGLPYPSKTEEIEAQYSPDPTVSSPTLSSSLTTIMIAALPRLGGGVHYSQPIRCGTNYRYCPALNHAEMYRNLLFDSELKTPPAQETANTTYLNNYIGEQVFPGLDALSGLPFLPPYSAPIYPLSPNSSSFPNPTPGNVFLRNPDNVELGLETSSHIGAFGGGTALTSFPRYDVAQQHRLEEFPGEWGTEGNAPRPVYSPTVTDQQVVPNAYHLPAYPTYMKANAVCSGSYDCSEVFGAWNAPEQAQTNAGHQVRGSVW